MAYDITELDVLEHNAIRGTAHSILKIDDTHAIVAYGGGSNVRLTVETFSVDGSYNITLIDSLEKVPGTLSTSMVQIDATHFLVVQGGSDNGNAVVYSIDGSYNITEVDAHEFWNRSTESVSLIKIDTNNYIVAFTGGTVISGNQGQLQHLTVADSTYNISSGVSYSPQEGVWEDNALALLDSTHIAHTFIDAADDGQVRTLSLDGSYVATPIDTHEYSTSVQSGSVDNMVLVDATHLLLSYVVPTTFATGLVSLSFDGSYILTEIDHVTSTIFRNPIPFAAIDSTNYFSAGLGATTVGVAGVITLDGSYNITEGDDYEFDSAAGVYGVKVIHLTGNYYMAGYSGAGQDGFVSTFSVEPLATFSPSPLIHQMAQAGGLM